MATVNHSLDTVSDQLKAYFDRIGDLRNVSVTLYNEEGEFTGNAKVARLMEVIDISRNGKREITLLTADLGQDTDEYERLFGSRPGSPEKKGLLQEKFNIRDTGHYISRKHMPALAEKMVEESHLDGNMQLGLKVIVAEKMATIVPADLTSVSSLRHLINGYLRRPMTPEWENELIARSPLTVAIQGFSKGSGSMMVAPEKAKFAKRGQKP